MIPEDPLATLFQCGNTFLDVLRTAQVDAARFKNTFQLRASERGYERLHNKEFSKQAICMIQLFHLYKNFGPSLALNDINLKIDEGEFVFITGPSGAGKTTLLRMIFGEERPTSGNILINGVNLNRIKGSKLALLRRNIGFVFQDFKLLSKKTVFKNVSLALEVTGERYPFIRKKTHRTLKLVGLDHKEISYPLQLSGGEQQRVAIARAIIQSPLILIADEPTGNLDPDLTRDIMDLFRWVHSKGTTVVIATHNRELLKEGAQRTIFLNHGRVAGEK